MVHRINPLQHTKAIGAYSAATFIQLGKGKLMHISGQVASDENGAVVGNTMTKQAEYVFKKIKSILNENGGSLNSLMSVTIFLTDLKHFDEFNAVRNRYLADVKPASTLLEISSLAIDSHLVEINGVAYIE